MNSPPALTDLTAFATIVAQGSFRKAADGLGLSPSTLSHMMRSLEATMGVRLLHRTTRSLSTTEAGERIPGLFVYYPGHRHVPLGLRAFLDVLKEQLP